MVNFIIHDPKTRKISKSDFRDRVVHHALCNIIEPIFEKSFIYDSYANRLNKGALKALNRFDYFKKKVGKNNTRRCFILKADIKKYFENIDHNVLVNILKKKIIDNKVLWLIKKILDNCVRGGEDFFSGKKGMPLGNLTSQFFANVYLNELDWFVKRKLKAKYFVFIIVFQTSLIYLIRPYLTFQDETEMQKYYLLQSHCNIQYHSQFWWR